MASKASKVHSSLKIPCRILMHVSTRPAPLCPDSPLAKLRSTAIAALCANRGTLPAPIASFIPGSLLRLVPCLGLSRVD